jgi:hypothetical protein
VLFCCKVLKINAKKTPPFSALWYASGLYHISCRRGLWDQNLRFDAMFLLSMFCANVLQQDGGFDSRTSLAGNVALTIGIASSTQKRGLFFKFIADTKSKGKKN